jgi:hypothetical protein
MVSASAKAGRRARTSMNKQMRFMVLSISFVVGLTEGAFPTRGGAKNSLQVTYPTYASAACQFIRAKATKNVASSARQ